MAEAYIHLGGGGVDSSDVTAAKAHVLSGYTTITSDSGDEVVQGTMPRIAGNDAAKSAAMTGDVLRVGISKGAHIDVPSGHVNPVVDVPLATVRQAVGYTDPYKVLSDTWIAGMQGAATVRGNSEVARNQYIYDQYLVSWIPGGYYPGWQRAANGELCGEAWTPMQNVRAVLGIDPNKIKKGEWIGGVQGVFEGYVPGVNDFYNNGNNVMEFRGNALSDSGESLSFEAGMMRYNSQSGGYIETAVMSPRAFNFSGKTRINMEIQASNFGSMEFYITDVPFDRGYTVRKNYHNARININGGQREIISTTFNGIAANAYFAFDGGGHLDYTGSGISRNIIYIYRIWVE